MIGERRRPLLDRDLLVRVGLAWLLIAVLMTVTSLSGIMHREYVDGDDIMRLVQVRDWLGGQGWFDTSQHRLNAPHGAPMHWSRLVDIPLAAVILVLSPVFGQPAAEMVASIAIPLLTMFFVVLLIGRIAWRLFDEETAGLACLAAALAAPLLYQLRPMRIDHHGWQIVLALLAVNALMARNARTGGWIVGASLAAWLAISLEGVPFVAAICGIALVRWLTAWSERAWLVSILQALTVASTAFYVLAHGFQITPTPATAGLCDTVLPAHLLALATVTIGATGLARGEVPRPWMFMILVLGSSALAAVIVLLQIAPQCSGGTFAGMDAQAHDIWLKSVSESEPLWSHPVRLIAQVLIPPMLGIFVSFRLSLSSSGWLQRWHLEYAALIGATLLVAILLPRASGLPAALAAVPIGYQLKHWLRALRHLHRPFRQAMAAAGIVTALLPAMPLTLLMAAAPGNAAPAAQETGISSDSNVTCGLRDALPVLGAEPANVMASIDMGPSILLDTPHRVVATPHHRAHHGIGDTIRTFTGDAANAHAILTRRDIDFVVICPDIEELKAYRRMGREAGTDNFAQSLSAGQAPDWLMPIATDAQGVMVWRVIG